VVENFALQSDGQMSDIVRDPLFVVFAAETPILKLEFALVASHQVTWVTCTTFHGSTPTVCNGCLQGTL